MSDLMKWFNEPIEPIKEKVYLEGKEFLLYPNDFNSFMDLFKIKNKHIVSYISDLNKKLDFSIKETTKITEYVKTNNLDKIKDFTFNDLRYKYNNINVMKETLESYNCLLETLNNIKTETKVIKVSDLTSKIFIKYLDEYYINYTIKANNNKNLLKKLLSTKMNLSIKLLDETKSNNLVLKDCIIRSV